MRYKWNDSFSVGYGPIDAQHRRLFSINTDLAEEAGKADGASEKELHKIIGDLLSYTRSHFAEEEELMQMAAFPDFARHKERHDALIAKIREVEARVRNGEVQAVAEFLPAMVGAWLAQHIAIEDQMYAGYLKAYVAAQPAPIP